MLEIPNIKRVNEKPIALQWVNSNLLSDTSDTSDMPKESNTKNNQNKNDDDAISKRQICQICQIQYQLNLLIQKIMRQKILKPSNLIHQLIDILQNKLKSSLLLRMDRQKNHTLEESICRPIIGIQNYKPFFKYCKICPKVEFLQLRSIEDHIRLNDSQTHKEKLLELVYKKQENKEEVVEELTQQQESEDGLFECYYCIEFSSTTNKKEYEKHTDSNHPGWPPYPSIADLKRLGVYAQGKKWEI